MQKLIREGYGSAFNELWFDTTKIHKRAKTEYGKKKIDFEKQFLSFVLIHSTQFPVPKGYIPEENGYSMYYYRDWMPLFQVLQKSPASLSQYLSLVYEKLIHLHSSSIIMPSFETIKQDLQYEMIDKLVERHKEVKSILEPYSYIQTVNGIMLEPYSSLLDFFQKSIDLFLQHPILSYCPIHGDCQFNNILVSPDGTQILFIDPRGYFGKTSLYGLKEYDYAKVSFALSGYDTFDASVVNTLDISGSNITLPEIIVDPSWMHSSPFISILTASIWMGNAHSFKDHPLKAIASYYYGLFYATRVFRYVKSLIK